MRQHHSTSNGAVVIGRFKSNCNGWLILFWLPFFQNYRRSSGSIDCLIRFCNEFEHVWKGMSHLNSDLKIVDELRKFIGNLNNLQSIRKLIAPTSSQEQKDIAQLIRQAQKLRQILTVNVNLEVMISFLQVDPTTTKSAISVMRWTK